MDVQDRSSAFLRVNATIEGGATGVTIELRHQPKLNDGQLRQMLGSLVPVTGLRRESGNRLRVEIRQGLDQESLDELVANICKLAAVVR